MRPLQLALLTGLLVVAGYRYIAPKTPDGAARVGFTTPQAERTHEIAGAATVIDGDTLSVGETRARVRLFGIDAPEKAQTCRGSNGILYPCGTRAMTELSRLLVRDSRVVCLVRDIDPYKRLVAECATAAGLSLNREMVRAGWALDYVRYSKGVYAGAQRNAQSARRGLWAGSFDDPAQWR